METVHDTSLAVYFADHDDVIECGACDPDYGDAADWPAWCDDDRWEPSEQDSQWAAQNLELPPVDDSEPTAEDLADYERWSRRLDEMHLASEWQDRLEGIYGPHGITDDDLAAAGLPVG